MKYLEKRLHFLIWGIAIIASCFATSQAYGQDPGPPPPDDMEAPQAVRPPKMNVDKEVAKMAKRYALSDAQKAQIRPILVEEQQKLDAVFQDSSLSMQDRFNKMRAIHQEQVSKIAGVLSDSQRSKYLKDEQRKDREQEAPDDMPPPPPDGPGGGMPPPGDD